MTQKFPFCFNHSVTKTAKFQPVVKCKMPSSSAINKGGKTRSELAGNKSRTFELFKL